MDPKKNIVFLFDSIKNAFIDKTADIKNIKADKNIFRITFLNGKSYPYSRSKVVWHTSPREFIVGDRICCADGKPLSNYTLVLDFGEYFKFFFEYGSHATYHKKEIKFVSILQKTTALKNVLAYFKEVAEFIEREQETKFLSPQLENLVIRQDSFLSSFLQNKNIIKSEENKTLIYPFGCNKAQKKAVENAFKYSLSVLQGPPGTGKTQTILNIIANAVLDKKTVAVVSGNNEAIRNVEAKLHDFGIDFITAFLGNNENIKTFFDCIENKNRQASLYSPSEKRVTLEQITEIEKEINTIQEYQIDIARLEKYLSELKIEKEKNDGFCIALQKDKFIKLSNLDLSSMKLLKLSAELEVLSKEEIKRLKTKIKFFFKYKIFNTDKHISDIDNAVVFLQNKYYSVKIQEIKKDIAIRKEYMKNHNFEQVIESYYALSKNYFQNFIATCKDKKKNSHFSMYDYRRFFEKFTKRFPVVFSTTHSLKNCSGEHFLYDYLIIDEASQVDLVTACIAFSCAEKVILVGDEMQLKHIVRESDAKHLQTVFAQYFLNNNFEYTKNSIIRSVSLMYKNQAPSVLLKEHYRCDPQIIGFCNKRFYDDQLVVRTAHKKGNGIEIILTESIHARGRTNPRQIEIIDREIIPKLRNEDIGIIAPYRDQVQLLENRFDNIVKTIDTVHKFQGKENDTVILSTVANKIKFYDDEEKNDFLNDPNLLNVAFSRAKNKLIVVASKELLYQENTTLSDFSKYLNYYCSDAIIQNTKVYSVFDLMFDEYNEILEELKVKMLKISKFDSENIIGTVIKDICQSKSFSMFDFKFNYPLKYVVDVSAISDKEDFAFANNRLTHCDFLIYHKLDKSVKLIVEVDGRQHKESTQAKRDARKDHIIKNAGYKILRLTTDTVACKEKIEKALSEG